MIQEVVGTRVGRYFLPAFAGVGFSNNEFRWSPRIRREDGLLRLVPGLGTRAVDRLARRLPGAGRPRAARPARQRHARRRCCATRRARSTSSTWRPTASRPWTCHALLREVGDELPGAAPAGLGATSGDHAAPARRARPATSRRTTWSSPSTGLLSAARTFLRQHAGAPQGRCASALGMPVDIEFASDGRDLYLLQCRPQSHGRRHRAGAHPRATCRASASCSSRPTATSPTARVPDITHIVYVDPDGYSELRRPRRAARRRAGGRPAQRPAAQAAVHPHGARDAGAAAATSSSA